MSQTAVVSHLDVGFDLVGDENELRSLSYYLKQLLRFRTRQKEEGVDIPFFLHAGETLGDGTETDMNLYDAILLGTKRIGHGQVSSLFAYSAKLSVQFFPRQAPQAYGHLSYKGHSPRSLPDLVSNT